MREREIELKIENVERNHDKQRKPNQARVEWSEVKWSVESSKKVAKKKEKIYIIIIAFGITTNKWVKFENLGKWEKKKETSKK